MKEIEIGDILRINHLERKNMPGHWVTGMRQYRGKEVHIYEKGKWVWYDVIYYKIKEDGGRWMWQDIDFEEGYDDFLEDKDMLL